MPWLIYSTDYVPASPDLCTPDDVKPIIASAFWAIVDTDLFKAKYIADCLAKSTQVTWLVTQPAAGKWTNERNDTAYIGYRGTLVKSADAIFTSHPEDHYLFRGGLSLKTSDSDVNKVLEDIGIVYDQLWWPTPGATTRRPLRLGRLNKAASI